MMIPWCLIHGIIIGKPATPPNQWRDCPATLVKRYVLAVLYFATSAEGGLSASSVCEWKGVSYNQDDLVAALNRSKSTMMKK
jgi:hypothetical protein